MSLCRAYSHATVKKHQACLGEVVPNGWQRPTEIIVAELQGSQLQKMA